MSCPTLVISAGYSRGISTLIRQPCGCLLQWYMGGKGYLRGGCAFHTQNQRVYICPANSCGKVLLTLRELTECKRSHAQ